MNKRIIFIIIIVLMCISFFTILILSLDTKYNKLIINERVWNSIINNKIESKNIKINIIKFNDYSLMVDEENVIYYSVIDIKNKFNPSVDYNLNDNSLKLSFNKEISTDMIENRDDLKIIIYNDSEYRIYNLVITNYPILSINYLENDNSNKIDIEFRLFDNHVSLPQRLLKSNGKLQIVNDSEYNLSLIKESLGHNKRKNHLSILGMEKHNEYVLKLSSETVNNEKYVQLFINNKYKGLYRINYNDERSDNGYERNKEINK